MNKYDPYSKYASSEDVVLKEFVLDNWKCELVEPNHSALYRRANIDPFKTNIDWVEREKDMIALMHDKMGMGLAATQVGTSYNMFVMTHSFLGDIGIYNPKVIETEGVVKIEEGCLTWPLLYITIDRPAKIKVSYTKTDGKTTVETWMDGMDARCFLHEHDHLSGTNFIDHAGPLKLKRAKEKRDKLFKKLSKRR